MLLHGAPKFIGALYIFAPLQHKSTYTNLSDVGVLILDSRFWGNTYLGGGGVNSMHFLMFFVFCITKNEEVHTIVNLTLMLKVNCQGQVNNFGLFDITDLELVRIDTKIYI